MDLIIRKDRRAGRITLNRPKSLNALTEQMIHKVATTLDKWRGDPSVDLVIIDAAGDKAFCAGGDIRRLYEEGLKANFDVGYGFWAEEYRLNAAIATYPKPLISFMQGYVMGGGVGLGCHAAYRIVDHGTKLAMPEVTIGLIPDVGGTHLLAQMPGHLGEYFGLTGARMSGAQAVAGGFADMLVPREIWPSVMDEICASATPNCLSKFAVAIDPPFREILEDVNRLFAAPTVPDILAIAPESKLTAGLEGPSPLAMIAALELIRAARAAPGLKEALEREYRFTARSLEHADFIEGIRAAIIDKDGAPKWQHAHAAEVSQAEAQMMLSPLPSHMTVFADNDNSGDAA